MECFDAKCESLLPRGKEAQGITGKNHLRRVFALRLRDKNTAAFLCRIDSTFKS